MPTATPRPKKQFEKVYQLEEGALLHLLGAPFMGASIDAEAGRVALSFEVPPAAGEALAAFRSGVGPKVNAPAFNASLRWSRDRIFDARRRGGLEGGR